MPPQSTHMGYVNITLRHVDNAISFVCNVFGASDHAESLCINQASLLDIVGHLQQLMQLQNDFCNVEFLNFFKILLT